MTKAVAPEEPAEFPVTLEEFVAESGNAPMETKRAFSLLMKTAGTTGHKLRAEWNALLMLFCDKPVGVEWDVWITTRKGGK